MEIKVTKSGSQYRASLHENGSELFVSQWHPRPGCATREAMLHMQILLGLPNKVVRLSVIEWM